MTPSLHLKPLSWWQTMGFFGAPWLLFMLAVHLVLPVLDRVGVPLFLNFLLCLGGPLALLLIAAGVAYRQEGWPWTWSALKSRFIVAPALLHGLPQAIAVALLGG